MVEEIKQPETPVLTIVERAEQANKKGEEIAKRIEDANKRAEEIQTRNILGGRSDMTPAPVAKEESAKEYKDRIMKGKV